MSSDSPSTNQVARVCVPYSFGNGAPDTITALFNTITLKPTTIEHGVLRTSQQIEMQLSDRPYAEYHPDQLKPGVFELASDYNEKTSCIIAKFEGVDAFKNATLFKSALQGRLDHLDSKAKIFLVKGDAPPPPAAET